MYNSVIECVKVSNMFIGLKNDLFGLVWKVWLYRRHSKSNQLIKITMTITTVLPFLFGLVWKVWLYRRHSKSNQLIKITMKITTVLHSRAAPSLLYLLTCLSSNQSECLQASLTSRTTMAVDKSSWAASVRQPWCMAWAMLSLNNDTSIEEHSNLPLIRFPDFGPPLKNNNNKE